MKCFRCTKEIKFDDRTPNNELATRWPIIYDALHFDATGNYGSTVFDPLEEPGRTVSLQILICDRCLTKNTDKVYVVEMDTERQGNMLSKTTLKDTHRKELKHWPQTPYLANLLLQKDAIIEHAKKLFRKKQ